MGLGDPQTIAHVVVDGHEHRVIVPDQEVITVLQKRSHDPRPRTHVRQPAQHAKGRVDNIEVAFDRFSGIVDICLDELDVGTCSAGDSAGPT